MTKGFLCITAALGTSLSGAMAFGETLETEEPMAAVERARTVTLRSAHEGANAATRAFQPEPINVSGWNVIERPSNHAPVVATLGDWTIVADAIEGDRLIGPRVIGPDTIMWADTARLHPDGVDVQDLFVASRNQNVRATTARVTLEPPAVELEGVGQKAQRAE